MNVGILIKLLANDPTLADDIPAWLARLNAPTIRRVTQQRQVIVNDVEEFLSFASLHGGDATVADVQAALAHRTRIPLADELRKRYERTQSAIDSGEVSTPQEILAKLREPLPADGS